MKYIITIISLLILLFISVFFNIKNLDRNEVAKIIATEDSVLLKNSSTETIGEKYPIVTVAEICDAFNSNKTLAQKDYASRIIILKGKVEKDSINLKQGTTILGKNQTSITFTYQSHAKKSGWFDYNTIICTVQYDQNDALKLLDVGKDVKLKGLMNGTIGKSIIIDGCVILK